jgi:hypothetical protein
VMRLLGTIGFLFAAIVCGLLAGLPFGAEYGPNISRWVMGISAGLIVGARHLSQTRPEA